MCLQMGRMKECITFILSYKENTKDRMRNIFLKQRRGRLCILQRCRSRSRKREGWEKRSGVTKARETRQLKALHLTLDWIFFRWGTYVLRGVIRRTNEVEHTRKPPEAGDSALGSGEQTPYP